MAYDIFPKNEKELSDAAFISANAKMIDNIRGIKLYQVALNEGLTAEMQNNIRMHLEGINPVPLTKAEQVIFDKYYQPLISELTKAYEYLKNINPELANQLGEMRDGKFFFNRMMIIFLLISIGSSMIIIMIIIMIIMRLISRSSSFMW